MDGAQPRAAHTSSAARRVHISKGKGRRCCCRGKHRSSATLYRTPVSVRKTRSKGRVMSMNNTYLAVFLGSKTSQKMTAWNALAEAERRAKERDGIAAWKAWVEK